MPEKGFENKEKRVDESWKASVSNEKTAKQAPFVTSEKPSSKQEGINFSDFITSLAIQSMMHLGLFPQPEGKEPVVNLLAAKELIDLLVLLKDKTRGNLTHEEEKLISSVVADLQLKYVQSTK